MPRADEFPPAERMIPRELDLAHLDLRPFFNLEDQDHRVARRNPLVLRRHLRKLPSVLAEQILQDHLCFFDAGWVKLAFHRQTDFFLFEPIQNVRFRNRMNAVVADAPDHRPLRHFEYDDLSIRFRWRLFHAQFYFFEKFRVPQLLEIPPQSLFFVGVPIAAEYARVTRVLSNAPVSPG